MVCAFLSIGSNGAYGAPQIDFVGNIYCHDGVGLEPAGNITIELENIPSEEAASKSTNGYYRKSAPYGSVYYHNVTLIYKIGNRILHIERVFVSKDRIKRRANSLIYKLDKVILDNQCDELKSEFHENFIRKHDKKTVNGAEGAASSIEQTVNGAERVALIIEVIKYMWALASVGYGAPGDPAEPTTSSTITTITRVENSALPLSANPSFKEGPGNLLASSRNELFPSFGFRYSPSRSKAPSILTNTAALALDEYGGEISIDCKLNSGSYLTGNINAIAHLFNRFVFGVGYYRNHNEENLKVGYDVDNELESSFTLNEDALLLSFSYRASDNLAFGVTNKYNYQIVKKPSYVDKTDSYGYYSDDPSEERLLSQVDSLVYTSDTNTSYDLDLSLAVDILSRFRIGATIINLLGSELIVDDNLESNRGYGIGVTTFLERYHVGIDIENTERFGTDSSFGVSYILMNNWELGAGYLTRDNTKKLSIRYGALYLSLSHGDVGYNYRFSSRFSF